MFSGYHYSTSSRKIIKKLKKLAVYCTKEALIGEHNHKPSLVIRQKKALIGIVFWEISK